MTRGNRPARRPGGGTVLASVTVHVLVLAGFWWTQRVTPEPYEYVAYELRLVSLGDLEPALPVAVEDPVVVSRQDDPPPPPEPEPEPPPPAPPPEPERDPEPEPDPRPEPEAVDDSAPPSPTSTVTPETAEPEEEPPSAAAMAVRMEGLRRDFPAYYQRILEEVGRCFRWNERGGWTAVVRFEIQRSGRIPGSSIRLFSRSGYTRFDFETVAAVECAGRGALGPLPEDMPIDVLPVQFTFGQQRTGE